MADAFDVRPVPLDASVVSALAVSQDSLVVGTNLGTVRHLRRSGGACALFGLRAQHAAHCDLLLPVLCPLLL